MSTWFLAGLTAIAIVASVIDLRRWLVDRLIARAKRGDGRALDISYQWWVSVDEHWEISQTLSRAPRPSQERLTMQPTPPAEHDPLFLKTLLDQLEQASPERAKTWLRSPEKGQKTSGGVARLDSAIALHEALVAARMQPSRVQFYPASITPIANPITWVGTDSAFPPVASLGTSHHNT